MTKPFNYLHCQIIKDWFEAESRGELKTEDVAKWLEDLGYTAPGIHRNSHRIVVWHKETNESQTFEV